MEGETFDLILTDLRMPGKSGLKVIDKALALKNRPPVIMMTAYGNVPSAVEAMKRGAYDFLTKPVNLEKLEILAKRALESKTLQVEVEQLEKVNGLHHLHCWSLDGESHVLTLHLILDPQVTRERILEVKCQVLDLLSEYPFKHITIEIELEGEECCLSDTECGEDHKDV